MIKSIRLKNFFSFKDEKIDFTINTNLLIGINGSGKSNLLKALKILKEGVNNKLENLILYKWGGFDNISFSGNTENEEIQKEGNPFNKYNTGEIETITLEYEFDKKILNYDFIKSNIFYKIIIYKVRGQSNYLIMEYMYADVGEIKNFPIINFQAGKGNVFTTGNKEVLKKYLNTDNERAWFLRYENEQLNPKELVLGQLNDPIINPVQFGIKKILNEIIVYDNFDTGFNSQMRKSIIATSENKLLPNGSNLVQVLNTIKITDGRSFNKIIEKLQEVNPYFIGIDYNILGGGTIELLLNEEFLNKPVHISNISDGTLKYLCLLSIFYNPKRGTIICIDEPETGLHPDMIVGISEAIKETSGDTLYIISTHSDNLLNQFDLNNIFIFEKDENNQTKVNKYNEDDFKDWYEEFFAGKMWRSGDIGGNRW